MNHVIRYHLESLIGECKRVEHLLKMSDAGANIADSIEHSIVMLSSILGDIKTEKEKDTRRPHYCSGIVVRENGHHRIICDYADSPRCYSRQPDLKIALEIEHNVDSILTECYASFLRVLPNPDKTKKIIGELRSPTWKLFVEKVVDHLKTKGCFDPDATGYIDTFEDTAGGCDEITWYAACHVIKSIDA